MNLRESKKGWKGQARGEKEERQRGNGLIPCIVIKWILREFETETTLLPAVALIQTYRTMCHHAVLAQSDLTADALLTVDLLHCALWYFKHEPFIHSADFAEK